MQSSKSDKTKALGLVIKENDKDNNNIPKEEVTVKTSQDEAEIQKKSDNVVRTQNAKLTLQLKTALTDSYKEQDRVS